MLGWLGVFARCGHWFSGGTAKHTELSGLWFAVLRRGIPMVLGVRGLVLVCVHSGDEGRSLSHVVHPQPNACHLPGPNPGFQTFHATSSSVGLLAVPPKNLV